MHPDVAWTPDMDMLDWLGAFFGFQVCALTFILMKSYSFCADYNTRALLSYAGSFNKQAPFALIVEHNNATNLQISGAFSLFF